MPPPKIPAVAVNVTLVPAQIAPLGSATMLTIGTKPASTVALVVPLALVPQPLLAFTS